MTFKLKFKSEIYLLILIELFFIFRSSIPSFKYPFILLYIYFVVNYLFSDNKRVSIKTVLKNYYLIVILVIVYIFAVIISSKLFLTTIKDLFNIAIQISIIYLMTSIIETKEKLDFFVSKLTDIIIYFSVTISFFLLYEFFHIYFLTGVVIKPKEFSLVDYNFALLPVFFGFFALLFKITYKPAGKKIILYDLLLLLFCIPVFLSGSKRGLFIILLTLIVLYLIFFVSLFYRNQLLKSFAKGIKSFLLLLTLFFISVTIFIFGTTYLTKYKTFEILGVKKISALQEEIARTCYRSIALFDQETAYSKFYMRFWSPVFDPKDPDTGWGTRIHKTIYPLEGKNVEIVPSDVKGYLMDSTCNADTWGGNAFSYTNSLFSINANKDNDTVEVSVFCYVSNDFNGDWVRIDLINNNSTWKGINYYNLREKGTWQKLKIKEICNKGEYSLYLYFCKLGVEDFSKLKGYVIFAYPQINIVSETIKANDDPNKNSITGRIVRETEDSYLPGKFITIGSVPKNSEAGFLSTLQFLFLSFTGNKDQDIIRNWIARLVSEDTTYYGYKTNFDIERTNVDKLYGERIIRWQFAWQIFKKEYNWPKRIFGGGFNFLNWYGHYFDNDKTRSDYPHNPFLHILLYSGIVGLLIYMVFMYKVFYYYILNIKEYPLLFIFFLITFFFTFFSGGNPFDPPIMGFFVMLPFLFHYIKERGKTTTSIDEDMKKM